MIFGAGARHEMAEEEGFVRPQVSDLAQVVDLPICTIGAMCTENVILAVFTCKLATVGQRSSQLRDAPHSMSVARRNVVRLSFSKIGSTPNRHECEGTLMRR